MLDTGTHLEEVAIIVNASSVVEDAGVTEAWARLLRPNVVVRVEGDCSETIRAWGWECECRANGRKRGVP